MKAGVPESMVNTAGALALKNASERSGNEDLKEKEPCRSRDWPSHSCAISSFNSGD